MIEQKDILCIEYNVFNRFLNHWVDLENNSLPVVLNDVIEEIEKELNAIALQEFTLNRNYL